MNKRSTSIAKWLTLGILTAAACDSMQPLASSDEDGAMEEGERTAQAARPPSLTKVDPAAVFVGSEGELTITGKGFVPGLKVTVGGLPAATPRVVTATKIQVALPAGITIGSAVSVRVTLPDGRYGERTDLFAVTADPIASGLTQPRTIYSLPSARAPVVADFNSDGRPDIAALTSGGIALYLSSSAGGALTAQAGPTTSSPYTMHATDVNKDGKSDLVVSSRTSSVVQIFVGNGDGTFQVPRSVTTSSSGFSDYQHNHIFTGDA